MQFRFISVAVAGFAIALSSPAFSAASVNGRWYTDGKDSIVEIGNCGAFVCGKVAKVLKNMPNGQPPIDANNPNPALRKRPVQGIIILSGFKDAGKHWAGSIYDPRAGKTYRSTLTRLTNGTLKVQGCWGVFCRSVYFTPA
jgi:uncharacterized protein (DUF2147 family)